MHCRHCGKQMDANAAVCTNCGVMRGRGEGFCWNCASTLGPNAAICVTCGADVRTVASRYSGTRAPLEPGARSKVTAGILGILLGGFGVHRFYLGYTALGVAQIVVTVCTFGIGSLWGTIEGILILCGQMQTDADGRRLAD
jgi:TM2 domain-containing membrane protein YozV